MAESPDERQEYASSPVPSVASSTEPMITVTRSRSRRLCSRLCQICYHGVTLETSDSHQSNGDGIAPLKEHQSNDDEDDSGGEREMVLLLVVIIVIIYALHAILPSLHYCC